MGIAKLVGKQRLTLLSRFSDWPARLQGFLDVSRNSHFQYGGFDCCLFVADAIQAMTGVDIAAPYRGAYRNRADALSAVYGLTGKRSVAAAADGLARAHQMEEVPVLFAQRGDMALMKRGSDYSMGLVSMNGVNIVIALRHGTGEVALTSATRVWHV